MLPFFLARTFGKEKFPLSYINIWKFLRKYPIWGFRSWDAPALSRGIHILRRISESKVRTPLRSDGSSVWGAPHRSSCTEHPQRWSLSPCYPQSRTGAPRSEIHAPRRGSPFLPFPAPGAPRYLGARGCITQSWPQPPHGLLLSVSVSQVSVSFPLGHLSLDSRPP